MPLFDMDKEALMQYRGSAVRPDDFDAYWARALEQMQEMGTEYTLIPADFQPAGAVCFDLWFTGVGGARIHAHYVRPKAIDKPIPAVVLFHGYNRNSGSWASVLGYAAAGMAVLAPDCRGQGGLSQDVGGTEGTTIRGHIIRGCQDENPDHLLMRSIFLDGAQLARIAMAMPEIDETRVAACGGSQGGGLALACAALTPKLNRVAAMMPFLCDYKRAWEMANPEGAYYELSYYFRFFDPRHEQEEQFYRRLGYIDNVNLAERIRAKTLMLTGLIDHECPPSTQFGAFNRITASKQVRLYPDYGHEVCVDMEDEAMRFLMEMTKDG